MKRLSIFAIAALSAAALASCNKQAPVPVPSVGSGDSVEVTVSIKGDVPDTRVVNPSYDAESKVNTLQILVYHEGQLETYRNVGAVMSAPVTASSGDKVIWAVVNAPDLSGCMTISSLESAVSRLSDNAPDSFVMTGSVARRIVDGDSIEILVKRIVARVSINKISTRLVEYRENYYLDVEGIYLINVSADAKYSVPAEEPAAWYNRLGHYDSAVDALLYDKVSGVVVRNGSPYESEHVFYPYPNVHPLPGIVPDYSDVWNPRGSLLVIEATMYESDGVRAHHGYYPIPLPAIERNKTYVIDEVCITRLPGDVPYRPIETGEAGVTVTVNEWEVGLNLGTVTI